jgi:hypothetical protein
VRVRQEWLNPGPRRLYGCENAFGKSVNSSRCVDEGYGFDDYGPGRRLDLSLLAGLDPVGARLFFPVLPSAEESGARRGCAVIGVGAAGAILETLPELRAQDWPAPNASQGVSGEPDAYQTFMRCTACSIVSIWLLARRRHFGRTAGESP